MARPGCHRWGDRERVDFADALTWVVWSAAGTAQARARLLPLPRFRLTRRRYAVDLASSGVVIAGAGGGCRLGAAPAGR
jgi:hypothetical protein